jgi:hypothetical protein
MKKFAFALVACAVVSLAATAGDAPKGSAVAAKECATCTSKTVTVYEPLTRREKVALPLVKEKKVQVVEVKAVEVKKAECCDSCTSCTPTKVVRTGPVRRLLGR